MVSSEFDEFTLPLGGSPYTFRFGLRELIELQERLVSTDGKIPSIQEIDKGIRGGRLRYRRALIWAGLRVFHPAVTEDAATDLMARASVTEMDAVLQAFGYSVTPDPRDVKELEPLEKNPRKARAQKTGATTTSALVGQA